MVSFAFSVGGSTSDHYVSSDTLSAFPQELLSTLIHVILSSAMSTVHAIATEVTTEAANSEVEGTVFALALVLVLTGVLMRTGGRDRGAAAVVSAGGFVLALITLAVAVVDGGWLTGADGPITHWVVGHRHPSLDAVALAVTTVAGPPETAAAGVIIAALLVWRTRRYAAAVILLATVGGAAITCTVIKLVVGRDRPPVATQLVLETDHSFPSGHVTGTATLLLMAALVVGQHISSTVRTVLVAAAIAIAALVAASRVYLGVHWLTDVFAGFLLAAVAVTLGTYALHLFETRTHHRSAAALPTAEGVTV